MKSSKNLRREGSNLWNHNFIKVWRVISIELNGYDLCICSPVIIHGHDRVSVSIRKVLAGTKIPGDGSGGFAHKRVQ